MNWFDAEERKGCAAGFLTDKQKEIEKPLVSTSQVKKGQT